MGGEQNSSLSITNCAQMWFRASYHNMQLGLETRFVKKMLQKLLRPTSHQLSPESPFLGSTSYIQRPALTHFSWRPKIFSFTNSVRPQEMPSYTWKQHIEGSCGLLDFEVNARILKMSVDPTSSSMVDVKSLHILGSGGFAVTSGLVRRVGNKVSWTALLPDTQSPCV